MAVAIRLFRLGKKDKPFYRIVVADRINKRQGKYIEEIGYYNPLKEPAEMKVNKERLDYWLSRGAILSEGLQKLRKFI
jgi:small subunit ribosomal protein S16